MHWYEQRYGLFADAMAFYTQKQAEYFNLPCSIISQCYLCCQTRRLSRLLYQLSSYVNVYRPAWRYKWFMMGANAEDDMRMRLRFREYRKIIRLKVTH